MGRWASRVLRPSKQCGPSSRNAAAACPTGAFYCFPDVSFFYGKTIGGTKITGSMDFSKALLEQANVAVVPGQPFGCDANVRLSFATSMEQITKGLDRMAKWLQG